MLYHQWNRESFDQWIENKRLLEFTVDLPEETIIFQGRMLEYNTEDNKITIYNELENEISKVELRTIEKISDEVDHYIDMAEMD